MRLCLHTTCRFFSAVFYLSSNKIAIAVLGNLAFALALCLYHLVTKARTHLAPVFSCIKNRIELVQDVFEASGS